VSEADKDQKQFAPSEQRLEKARREGQSPKSKDLGGAVALLAGGALMATTSGPLVRDMISTSQLAFRRIAEGGDPMTSMNIIAGSAMNIGLSAAPLLLGVAVLGTFACMMQTGFLILPELVLPKLERLDPMKALASVFSLKEGAFRTLMALLKTGAVAIAVMTVLDDELAAIDVASYANPAATSELIAGACLRVFLSGAAMLGVLSAIDFAWQRWRFMENMKMTREEMKQEHKQDEGSPEVKGRRRQIHREMSMNRVMAEVPKATVVVTNPTHVAVALRYEPGDPAPRVVAKGVESMALAIRRVARENGVPIIENRPLARALNRKVKVGRVISEEFYQAVAEVLAFVFRIRDRALGRAGGRGGRNG
jgi:flagellar biosynthesis protein FlhB